VGEPVTEEMRQAIEAFADVVVEMQFEEDREARAKLSRRIKETLSHAIGLFGRATAAGYARAERDVVAWLRHQAAEHERLATHAWGAGLAKSSDQHGQSAIQIMFDATAIEQGAHRGASERAETGGEERR